MFALKYASGSTNKNYKKIKNSKKLVAFQPYWAISDEPRAYTNSVNISSTSFRDVIYPDFFHPPDNLIQLWDDSTHPLINTHKYIAQNVFNAFVYLIKASIKTKNCDKDMNSNESNNFCNLNSYVSYNDKVGPLLTCAYYNTTIMMSTKDTLSKNSFILGKHFNETNSNWKFEQDFNPRLGWIYDSKHIYKLTSVFNNKYTAFRDNISFNDLDKNSILSFEVTTNNTLSVTYLISHFKNFANFFVWFDEDIKNAILIDSYRSDINYSVPDIFSFYFKNFEKDLDYYSLNKYKMLTDLAPGNHTLNIYPVPNLKIPGSNKLKIIGIKYC